MPKAKLKKHDIEGLVHRAQKAAKELQAERNRVPAELEVPSKKEEEEEDTNSEKSFFDDIK